MEEKPGSLIQTRTHTVQYHPSCFHKHRPPTVKIYGNFCCTTLRRFHKHQIVILLTPHCASKNVHKRLECVVIQHMARIFLKHFFVFSKTCSHFPSHFWIFFCGWENSRTFFGVESFCGFWVHESDSLSFSQTGWNCFPFLLCLFWGIVCVSIQRPGRCPTQWRKRSFVQQKWCQVYFWWEGVAFIILKRAILFQMGKSSGEHTGAWTLWSRDQNRKGNPLFFLPKFSFSHFLPHTFPLFLQSKQVSFGFIVVALFASGKRQHATARPAVT